MTSERKSKSLSITAEYLFNGIKVKENSKDEASFSPEYQNLKKIKENESYSKTGSVGKGCRFVLEMTASNC